MEEKVVNEKRLPNRKDNRRLPLGSVRVAFAGIILLASIGMGFARPESPREQTPLRIMMLGDSITQGAYYNDSYRYYLWKALVDADIEFDFVGSLSANYGGNPNWVAYKGQTFDPDHEGHWGWCAENILRGIKGQRKNNLKNWLDEYTPDIVLIHIGTNDIYRSQSHKSTVKDLNGMIKILRADNPNVVILLAQLIPLNRDGIVVPIGDLNKRISSFAAEMSEPGSPVFAVNQYTGFSVAADTYDGIHPNKNGEEKMAARWFEALQTVIVERFPNHIPSA